jgi:hypothetical protein
MILLISKIYQFGNFIGPVTNVLFVIIMAVGMAYCMKKYLN